MDVRKEITHAFNTGLPPASAFPVAVMYEDLASDSVYARVRHPIYLALWLMVLVQPLLSQNWAAGPPAVAVFTAMYFLRVPVEERMLRARFGPTWDAHAARTGRILPHRIR